VRLKALNGTYTRPVVAPAEGLSSQGKKRTRRRRREKKLLSNALPVPFYRGWGMIQKCVVTLRNFVPLYCYSSSLFLAAIEFPPFSQIQYRK